MDKTKARKMLTKDSLVTFDSKLNYATYSPLPVLKYNRAPVCVTATKFKCSDSESSTADIAITGLKLLASKVLKISTKCHY